MFNPPKKENSVLMTGLVKPAYNQSQTCLDSQFQLISCHLNTKLLCQINSETLESMDSVLKLCS